MQCCEVLSDMNKLERRMACVEALRSQRIRHRSFLLTFRLNYSYSRYWEGATAVHQMTSKWLDCAVCMSAFHYQSAQFDDIKPPTYGTLDRGVTKDQIKGRQRHFEYSKEETERRISGSFGASSRKIRDRLRLRRKKPKVEENFQPKSINSKMPETSDLSHSNMNSTIPIPTRFQDQFLRPGDGDPMYYEEENINDRRKRWQVKQSRAYHHLNRSRRAKLPSPSLFLQETAHLISLLHAVAMSTLRNDIDQATSPITSYAPGMEWPPVDPDYLSKDVQRQYGEAHTLWRWFYFCLGMSRSPRRRTMYNAARPFGVLGGVSDAECDLLQKARGPYAKVALVTMVRIWCRRLSRFG